MEQTKGYLTLKGRIWSLNNKKPFENDLKKSLSFGLQTSKENSIFLQVGEWKNTTLTVKVKGEGMTEVEELNEQDAIDKVQEVFKDGDSVFINIRASVNTYSKKIDYIVNQIYIEKEVIDFEAEDFEEVNHLNQSIIIIDKPSNKAIKAGVVTFKGEMIELEFKLSDEDVNDYFVENAKVGDLYKVIASVNRKPNYVEGEEEATSTRKTLKGKTVGGTGKRKIDGYTESLEIVDVDIEKTEKKKYTREDIREALELTENRNHKINDDNKEDDNDLPY